jgi:hypothetical protein
MTFRRALLAAVALLAAAQIVPVSRENPPVQEEVPAPPPVRELLRRSCYDCHSNETRWPWYSRVAPISWLVAYDVRHARKHVNFSTWDRYSEKKRGKIREEIWEQVRDGEMPLWYYLPAHPDARLADADRELLRGWTGGERGEAQPGEGGPPPG